MLLAGRVWNTLPKDDKLALLAQCHSITRQHVKDHESTLGWDRLMPVTQDDLLMLDWSIALGRDVEP